jgi:hypothetical protein
MVHEKASPSRSLIGILQLRLNRFPAESFAGEGKPNVGGLLSGFVENIYHLRMISGFPGSPASVVIGRIVAINSVQIKKPIIFFSYSLSPCDANTYHIFRFYVDLKRFIPLVLFNKVVSH